MSGRFLIPAAALGLALAGCGDSAADKTEPFVGAWTVATGSTMITCPAPLPTLTLPFDKAEQTFVKGTDSDLVMTPLPGCMLKVDVAGQVATMRPNQTCNLTVMGLSVAAAITSGTFTVTGTSAAFSYSGTGMIGIATCTFTAAGTSTKGSAGGDAGAPPPG